MAGGAGYPIIMRMESVEELPLATELGAEAAMPPLVTRERATLAIILALSFCHMLNDTIQSLIPSIYPMLKTNYGLDFAQIGLITLTFQITASILQPLVGLYTDKKPQTYALAVGMGSTLIGLLLFSQASTYPVLLVAAALVGTGSSVFHPESSRVARMASGGRHGFAQALFQVGGNVGASMGPLLAAFIVLTHGQGSIAWFSAIALVAICVLLVVGRWYRTERARRAARPKAKSAQTGHSLSRSRVAFSIGVLVTLAFSKNFYLASLGSYYTFFLIDKFGVGAQNAQIHLFVFLASVAFGTFVGGPIGDRIGRKYVIWGSILGVLPFTLLLPYVGYFWIGPVSVGVGMVLASAFPAIVVFAQELVPGKVGTVAGIFFGVAFGAGGLGAAALGALADVTSIGHVFRLCAFIPAIGLLTALLPDIEGKRRRARRAQAQTQPAAE